MIGTGGMDSTGSTVLFSPDNLSGIWRDASNHFIGSLSAVKIDLAAVGDRR